MSDPPVSTTRYSMPDPAFRPGAEGATEAAEYRRYREAQARELLALIPREGVRPLYRAARERALERGDWSAEDPLGALVRFCVELLPLPPLEVWKACRGTDGGTVEAWPPPWREAVVLDLRRFRSASQGWLVQLEVFHRDGAWRGFLRFSEPDAQLSYRTADIFRESHPHAVRDRFRELDPRTLEAFLRSLLP